MRFQDKYLYLRDCISIDVHDSTYISTGTVEVYIHSTRRFTCIHAGVYSQAV